MYKKTGKKVYKSIFIFLCEDDTVNTIQIGQNRFMDFTKTVIRSDIMVQTAKAKLFKNTNKFAWCCKGNKMLNI